MIASKVLLALSASLLLTACLQGQEPSVEPARANSPMEALEAQRNAVLEAENLDDVLEYLPEYARSHVAELSKEERAAALAEWKDEVGSERAPRPVRERVGEGRGVVWMESDGGVRLTVMELENGCWTTTDDVFMQEAVPGARGGFTASGAVEHEVGEGVVQMTHLNGIPVMTVSDPLRKYLEERDVPIVQLALETCLGTGAHPLEPIEARNATVGSRYTHVPSDDSAELATGREESKAFKENVTGNLEVESVEGDRFDGTFRFRAETEEGETVAVEGWVEDATIACDEDVP